MAKNAVFTLTSGRSGTLYLSELLRQNSQDCTVIHESYLHFNNPNMFGLPIYDHCMQNLEEIRKLVQQKNEIIQKFPLPVYIETSHAFLKSYWDIAPEFFPQMKLVHLIRNPLEVAKSEAKRTGKHSLIAGDCRFVTIVAEISNDIFAGLLPG